MSNLIHRADADLERTITVNDITGEIYNILWEWSVSGGPSVYSATPLLSEFPTMLAGTSAMLHTGETVEFRGRWFVVAIENGTVTMENASRIICDVYSWCGGDHLEGARTSTEDTDHQGPDMTLGTVKDDHVTASRVVNSDVDGYYISARITAEVDHRDLRLIADQFEAIARQIRELAPKPTTPAKWINRRSSK